MSFTARFSTSLPKKALAQSSALGQVTAGSCSKIGNNTAVRFGASLDFNEAPTLAILNSDLSNQQQVIAAINSSTQPVIVRFGGEFPTEQSTSAVFGTQYGQTLAAISQAVGGKRFIAQAGHNEANCREYVPIGKETSFVRAVASVVGSNDNITLITGQIDIICDWKSIGRPDSESPNKYISSLSAISGIDGVALPFYTGDAVAGNASIMIGYLDAAIAVANGKPIYISESGPFKTGGGEPNDDEFKTYVEALQQILDKVENIMLFNAFGLNKTAEADTGNSYNYTKRFWSKECRLALQTSCQDTDAVLAACGGGDDADKLPFYLYPIKGLFDPVLSQTAFKANDPRTDQRRLIAKDLSEQGYEVQCSTPKIDLLGKLGGAADKWPAGTPGILEVTTSVNIDIADSFVPVLRGQDSNSFASSLETYTGTIATGTNPDTNQLETSPLYKLTDLTQQCKLKKNLLDTIEQLCAKYQDPSSCALYKQIPNSSMTTKELHSFMSSGPGKNCEELMLRTGDQYPNQMTALKNLPLYMDNAYRLGFLVVAAEYKNPFPPPVKFNFLRWDGTFPERHEVRVFAFKIPDYSTNRDLEDLADFDGLTLTKNALLQEEEIQALKKARTDERLAWAEKAMDKGIATNPSLIGCNSSCSTPLTEALVDIINSRGQGCGANYKDVSTEPATQIKSSAKLPEAGSVTLDTTSLDANSDLLNSLSKSLSLLREQGVGQTTATSLTNPEINTGGKFDFLSQINLDPSVNSSADAQIVSYLVIPQGKELEDVEKTLASVIFSNAEYQDWLGAYQRNEKPNYFQIEGVNLAVTATRPQTAPFGTNPDCTPTADNNCQYQVEATVEQVEKDEFNFAPGIQGPRLGNIFKNIQTSLHNVGSEAFDCLTSIQTTEQFLRFRCGTPANLAGPQSTLPTSCQNKYTGIITLPKNLAEAASVVNAAATAKGVSPSLAWGILEIEGSSSLRAIRTGQTSISCEETINACGAVGPTQIIDGACVSNACNRPAGTIAALRTLGGAPGFDLCTFEGAVAATVQRLANTPGDDYNKAARYHGIIIGTALPDGSVVGNKCEGTNNRGICGSTSTLNYCQCAVEGFNSKFSCLLQAAAGGRDGSECLGK